MQSNKMSCIKLEMRNVYISYFKYVRGGTYKLLYLYTVIEGVERLLGVKSG